MIQKYKIEEMEILFLHVLEIAKIPSENLIIEGDKFIYNKEISIVHYCY